MLVREMDSIFIYLGVFCDLGFELSGDEVFDLFGARAGPGRQSHCNAHGNVRVFALRHAEVAEDSPYACPYKQHPRDVPSLYKKPRRVVSVS